MTPVKQFGAATASAPIALSRREARERTQGAAAEDPTGRSYDEDMFRYFLALERKRFDRSRRPFLLLLVEARKRADEAAQPFEARVAAQIFDVLWQTVRDTDFVGWYRGGRVAGAVLTQAADGSLANAAEVVRDRVVDALCETVAPKIARRLQLRVYRLPTGVKEHQQTWL
jgi:hypothetical protein